LEILKLFWGKRSDGTWEIQGMSPISLSNDKAKDKNFYLIQDDICHAQPNHIGTIKSFLGQSIVPIVAHVPGESILRCLGTGFFISCTGLLITAAHVITDPIERQYGGVKERDDNSWDLGELKMGVMIPLNPVFQGDGYIFRDIEWASFLAERSENPLPISGVDLKLTSDTAICKVLPLGDEIPHQPLSIVQKGLIGLGMSVGKAATTIGYADMHDVELTQVQDGVLSGDFKFNLHVSTGKIIERFTDNFETKSVPAPGACFSASLKLPGGMSGSPIFDDERIYVHGVVSKGWEDENGPTDFGFGSMLAYSLNLPIKLMEDKTLIDLMKNNEHGISKLSIPDA